MAVKATRSLQELSAEVATNPGSTAFVELAAAYREHGDFDRARRLCLRGLQRHPTHVEAHFELGRIYEAQGEPELALDEWGIVRQLAPDHLQTRWALVRLLLQSERLADAEAELQDLGVLAPDDPRLAQFRAELQKQRERAAQRELENLFDHPELELPGTLGILLVDPGGEVLAGRLREGAVTAESDLGPNMSGARAEAERVAAHLRLGGWKGMIVESEGVRISVAPVKAGVIIVVTAPRTPAGRVARVVDRAREVADRYLLSLDR